MDRATLDRLRSRSFVFDKRYDELADIQTNNDTIREAIKEKKKSEILKSNELLEEQNSKKLTVNLAITLEPEGKDQFDRTTNNVW